MGNVAGFAAPYITGAVKDWTGGYVVPMVIVGGFMALSALLAFLILPRLEGPVAAPDVRPLRKAA